ncbi:hypothetical protein [Arenimonas donghaensis]|uniref:EF-hand domain-containing protein n=1 Tax=Arenimonas donghaensis DSM 18148 = HO3-R19 TaxID=1121014 RepID=A0A087MFF8_9GAMM|nr:hypothetical protein [Arenimonas donghaensis]KFL35611.1 hypothetical protein N788_07705 [Arenimonas donghaensis DSM 18148 = HO3-R19]
MKRTLISLMLSAPMLALAAEPMQAAEPAQTTLAAEPDCAPTGTAGPATASGQDEAPALPCVDTTAAAAPVEPAYVPKTAHDNSPYRFDMNQNGKRMTAEEFDAWMQAKGIRVATGQPGAASGHRSATQGTSAANPVTPAPDTKPSPPPPREDD